MTIEVIGGTIFIMFAFTIEYFVNRNRVEVGVINIFGELWLLLFPLYVINLYPNVPNKGLFIIGIMLLILIVRFYVCGLKMDITGLNRVKIITILQSNNFDIHATGIEFCNDERIIIDRKRNKIKIYSGYDFIKGYRQHRKIYNLIKHLDDRECNAMALLVGTAITGLLLICYILR